MSLLSRLFSASAPDVEWLEQAELRRSLDSGTPPLIVDVREPDEFDGPLGHIEGAANIPLAALSARTGELAVAERPIVTVCLTDKRSAKAAVELAAAGMKSVRVLRGGIKAWRQLAE